MLLKRSRLSSGQNGLTVPPASALEAGIHPSTRQGSGRPSAGSRQEACFPAPVQCHCPFGATCYALNTDEVSRMQM